MNALDASRPDPQSPATLEYAVAACALGTLLVAGTAAGVRALLLGDGADAVLAELERRFPGTVLRANPAGLESWLAGARALVERPAERVELPLDARGTPFQQRVWQELRRIPAGRTATYREIAARIGRPDSVRAVAGACAANPLAIAVPCHRVVRQDGELAGYRWGVERKRALLAREAVA